MATKNDDKLAVIEKEISPIVAKAQALTIKDEKSMTGGAELLSTLNLRLDKIVEEKEKITKPLNEALKVERARWKPFETVLDEAISLIRKKMGTYHTEQTRLANEEEARIVARVGEGKGHLKAETAVRQMEDIDRPAGAVAAASGMVKFKTVKVFEVMDLTMLPIEYHLANEVAIRKAMNAGIELAGVKYSTEQRPDNYR